MKTGKARLLGTDQDLRAKYEGIDAVKYDVILCPHCGYAALNRYFNNITKVYAKLIKENISSKVQLHTYDDDIYTYEEAIERYKLCLANAVVKRAHASEKAYLLKERMAHEEDITNIWKNPEIRTWPSP